MSRQIILARIEYDWWCMLFEDMNFNASKNIKASLFKSVTPMYDDRLDY